MTERVMLENIFGSQIEAVTEDTQSNIDSITGAVSLDGESVKRLTVKFHNGTSLSVICKYKSGAIIKNGISLMNHKNDFRLLAELTFHRKLLGFNDSHIREALIYEGMPQELRKNLIDIYGIYRKGRRAQSAVIMKDQAGASPKTKEELMLAIDAVTDIHAYYYNNEASIKQFALNSFTKRDYKRSKALLSLLFESLDDNEKVYKKENIEILRNFIQSIDEEYRALPCHKSLCHNDFSCRNILCEHGHIYIYDWELAAYTNPEHDLVDLLCSTAHTLNDGEILELAEYFKKALEKKTGIHLSKDCHARLISFNLLEFTLARATLLRIANLKFKKDFIDELAHNTDRLITLFLKG